MATRVNTSRCSECLKKILPNSDSDKIFPLRDPSIPRKTKIYLVLKTWVVVLTWVCLALPRRLLGIALPDLLPRVGADYETIARALSFGSLATVGGFLLAYLCDRYKHKTDLLIGITAVIASAFIFSLPWTRSLPVFAVVNVVIVLGSSSLSPVLVSEMTKMWKGNSAVPLHLALMGYTIGGLIAPLIAEPFLSPNRIESNATTEANSTDLIEYINGTHSKPPHGELSHLNLESQIEIPYAIASSVLAVCGFCFVIFQFTRGPPEVDDNENENNKKPSRKTLFKKICSDMSPKSWARGDLIFGTIVLVGLSVYYIALRGHIGTIGLFYFAYAVEGPLAFQKSEAVALASTSSAFVLGSRVVSVFVAAFCPIQIMIFVEAIGTVACCIVFAFVVQTRLQFWITICVYKFLAGALWPAGYSWAAVYVIPTATFFAWLSFVPSLVDFGLDWYVGYLFQRVSSDSIMVYCFVCSLVGATALTALQAYATASRRELARDKEGNETQTTEDADKATVEEKLLKETSI